MDVEFLETILVVDSPAGHAGQLASLPGERDQVVLAENGAAAIRLAQGTPRPALIIAGLRLPDMDGFSLFNEIKCSFLCADIPILLMMPGGQPHDERRAMRDGAAAVITTPLLADTVPARVATHVALWQARALLKDRQRHLAHMVGPDVVDAMLAVEEKFKAIAAQFQPPGPPA